MVVGSATALGFEMEVVEGEIVVVGDVAIDVGDVDGCVGVGCENGLELRGEEVEFRLIDGAASIDQDGDGSEERG